MKDVFKNVRKYVIAAPVDLASGGPELLHQLCHCLRKNGKEAYMLYYDNKLIPVKAKCHPVYEKYNTVATDNVEILDSMETVLIVPETAVILLKVFEKCIRCVWWLSVNNYLSRYQSIIAENSYSKFDYENIRECATYFNLDPLEICSDTNIVHLSQSDYSTDFLYNYIHALGPIYKLSDYINTDFYSTIIPDYFRQNIIAYNPKKGFVDLEPLIKAYPNYTWFAINNMSPKEVSDLLHLSKVYVDFGAHPGKDRIPREAAISGCCVITNKKGSAFYSGDVPIPDMYKFDNPSNSILQIGKLIQDIFDDYEKHFSNFQKYCAFIKAEEEIFNEDVERIFC